MKLLLYCNIINCIQCVIRNVILKRKSVTLTIVEKTNVINEVITGVINLKVKLLSQLLYFAEFKGTGKIKTIFYIGYVSNERIIKNKMKISRVSHNIYRLIY